MMLQSPCKKPPGPVIEFLRKVFIESRRYPYRPFQGPEGPCRHTSSRVSNFSLSEPLVPYQVRKAKNEMETGTCWGCIYLKTGSSQRRASGAPSGDCKMMRKLDLSSNAVQRYKNYITTISSLDNPYISPLCKPL